MENQENVDKGEAGVIGSRVFTAKRLVIAILLIVAVILIGGKMLGFFTLPFVTKVSKNNHISSETVTQEPVKKEITGHDTKADEGHAVKESPSAPPHADTAEHQEKIADPSQTAKHYTFSEGKDDSKTLATGVAFVEATIQPLRYELSERFWGWRPNDIFSFMTDNINNFQLGVIEVTRRTVEKLSEDISRTGATASFDENLEIARSTCFVIEAESLMFPSSEGKYNDGLEELEAYAEKLKKGKASFYTRADNLIPLLKEFEHLLGSCDNNLVKMREEDGNKVSFLKADNYFFYARGVASTMGTILKAVEKDFYKTLDRRNCLKDLHHAIESCEHAVHINPIIITNSDLSSIFANHRANMAAHISHARFYIGVLIKTLST